MELFVVWFMGELKSSSLIENALRVKLKIIIPTNLFVIL